MSTISLQRHPARGSLLACLLGGPLLAAAGCQTPQTATVAPPPTGMIGQPASYGSWATPPQGAAYPPTVSAPPMPVAGTSPPPMPGPATQWQAAAPPPQMAPPAAPTNGAWSWSQPSTGAPPSIQQYGNQLQAQAGQTQQGMTAQAQQYANQMQGQAQQYANQAQQYANQQMQQANTQAQGAMNQYTQQMQQAVPQMQQQVTAQMPTAQPTNTSWNPFATSAQSLPPARATPTTAVPRY